MIANYTATDGRHYKVLVPDHAAPDTWARGIYIGPPDLSGLGLPEEVSVRLHNELFNRGIITQSDANARRPEVHAALMYALRVDAERVINAYKENGDA